MSVAEQHKTTKQQRSAEQPGSHGAPPQRMSYAEKFHEYQVAGIREYWIIDPRPGLERADFYVLDEAGRYQPVPIAPDGTYRSTLLPDFWLRVAWLWQEEPNVPAALTEVVGVERVIAALRAAAQ